jgi:SAM-dependent methyltransferase
MSDTTSRDFFERMYDEHRDPWAFASSEYEQARYATILKFVPPRCFRHVFEPGCSIGELTARLARRCRFVTGIDIAEAAVATARQRCERFANVDVHQGRLPDDVPAGPFDLVVFSEIGYYFTESQLIDLLPALATRIETRGQLIAVHWTGESSDHVLSGRQVHDLLESNLQLDHLHGELHRWDDQNGFVLDIWRKAPPDGGRHQ